MQLQVGSTRLTYFEKVEVAMAYDAVASTFSFDFLRSNLPLFKPLSYPFAQVFSDDGNLLISGRLISNAEKSSPVKNLSGIAGYSLAGPLEDCTLNVDDYPLQSDGLSIRQIVDKMLAPFGIKYVVHDSVGADMDAVLEASTADEKQTIRSYLSQLCSQKNITITHGPAGNLIFTRPNGAAPAVASFALGQENTFFDLKVNGQTMHSSITVVREQGEDDPNAAQATAKNPLVSSFRPLVKTQDSGSDMDSELAARMAVGDELKSIMLTISTSSWKKNGTLLLPGHTVTVKNSEIGLNSANKWFVHGCRYSGNKDSQTADIDLVLPAAYDPNHPIIDVFK